MCVMMENLQGRPMARQTVVTTPAKTQHWPYLIFAPYNTATDGDAIAMDKYTVLILR